MIIYTIEQKMSGTGSMLDLASNVTDRDIRFKQGTLFATVLPAHYGWAAYTTHKTLAAANAKAEKLGLGGYSGITVIDHSGKVITD